jgi:hypothetical protein
MKLTRATSTNHRSRHGFVNVGSESVHADGSWLSFADRIALGWTGCTLADMGDLYDSNIGGGI